MTRKQLGRSFSGVIFSFFILIIAAILLRWSSKSNYWYDFIKDFSALFIAIGAAYLAYCFQQRQAFLFALRELWSSIVKSKAKVDYYVRYEHPDPDAYRKAYLSLSRVIDLVRGIYSNVGESRAAVGLYPFEPLHDVRKYLDEIRDVELDETSRATCVAKIGKAWESLRFAFLREFDLATASDPVTKHFSSDPRRPDKN